MIIGFLFTIKGAFNILNCLNYFIFKDNFKMITMELTSVYKSPVSVHEITYIYCYQSIHQGTNVKYKTKGHDYKKEVGDIDFFYYDERLHIVYEDEEYVISYMILGIFLFLFGLRIIFLYIFMRILYSLRFDAKKDCMTVATIFFVLVLEQNS